MAGPSFLAAAARLSILSYLLGLCKAQTICSGTYCIYEEAPLVLQTQPGSFFSSRVSPGQYQYPGQYTYNLTSLDGVPKPAWLNYNTTSHNISGTPPVAQRDQLLRFQVTARDSYGYGSSQNITIQNFIPCPANRFRHFRVQISTENNPAWYGGYGDLSAICDISWQAGATSFPSGAASEVVSSKPAADSNEPPWYYDSYRRTPEYAFQHIYGPPHDGRCTGYSSWRGSAGESVAVDLGYQGCQPWPSSISIQSPYDTSYSIGMPTAFTVDASGAAYQPADSSPQWARLLTITDFAPVADPSRGIRYPGTYNQTFAIPLPDAPADSAPVNATSASQLTVLAGSRVADTLLDVSAIFQSSSRSAPLQYGLIPGDFTPLGGLTAAAASAPPASSLEQYEWINTFLELLPKYPGNATLLSADKYQSLQKDLINITDSFEGWLGKLGIVDVPFGQLGAALSTKLANGALADWLGSGVQGLLNRLGLKGVAYQPDITWIKQKLAAPSLPAWFQANLPSLFAALDVSDATLQEVFTFVDTTVKDPGLTSLLDSSLRDWIYNKYILEDSVASTVSGFSQALLKLNALQLLSDNLPTWADRLGISDSTLQQVVALVQNKALLYNVSTSLGSRASTWLSEQGFSDVTVDAAIMAFRIKVQDGSVESYIYDDLYSLLDGWGWSDTNGLQALADLGRELADVNVQRALLGAVPELWTNLGLPVITFQQVLGNVSSTLQDMGLLQQLSDTLSSWLEEQGLTDVTLKEAATQLSTEDEDDPSDLALWLSTNVTSLVNQLQLSDTTLQQVATTLIDKLQESNLLLSIKDRVATLLVDRGLSSTTVQAEITSWLQPQNLTWLSKEVVKFVEWYGPREYVISQLVIVQSNQLPASALGTYAFQLTACNPGLQQCASIPLTVNVVLPPPPPPPAIPPPPAVARGGTPSPSAAPPKVQPSLTPSPPPVVQVPANSTSTTLEANYNLEGDGLWLFEAAQQSVFIGSIVALNLSGVTSDDVKFISADLITGAGRRLLTEQHDRHLLQAQVSNNGQSVDVKFSIQAQSAAVTSVVANQLYAATTAGTLTQELATRAATQLPGSTWSPTLKTITAASPSAATLTPPPPAATPAQLSAQACRKRLGSICLDNSSLSRGGVIGIIIGGSVFVLLLIGALISTIVVISHRRRAY